jgi:hypothetical protein
MRGELDDRLGHVVVVQHHVLAVDLRHIIESTYCITPDITVQHCCYRATSDVCSVLRTSLRVQKQRNGRKKSFICGSVGCLYPAASSTPPARTRKPPSSSETREGS